MFNIMSLFTRDPDFTNEIGVKFWHDKNSTEYAQSKHLDGVAVVAAEEPSGARSFLIIKEGQIIHPPLRGLEPVGCALDMMAMNIYGTGNPDHLTDEQRQTVKKEQEEIRSQEQASRRPPHIIKRCG